MKKGDMLINHPFSVTPAFRKKIDSCLQVLNQCLICDTASILLIKSVRSMELHNFFSMSYQQSLILLRQYWHSQRLYNIYVSELCYVVLFHGRTVLEKIQKLMRPNGSCEILAQNHFFGNIIISEQVNPIPTIPTPVVCTYSKFFNLKWVDKRKLLSDMVSLSTKKSVWKSLQLFLKSFTSFSKLFVLKYSRRRFLGYFNLNSSSICKSDFKGFGEVYAYASIWMVLKHITKLIYTTNKIIG